MKKFVPIVFVLVSLGMLSGCSVFMAANQPGKKDLSVFDVGTPRANVIAEIGAPEWSDTKDGKKMDVFKFVQGYSTGAKVSRSVFHGVADVFTLGLWEVVGTPTEAVFDGKNSKFEVQYDANDKVEKVTSLVKKDNR